MQPFNKSITIQKCDEDEKWSTLFTLYARINKSSSSKNEYLNGGAERSRASKTFEVRYMEQLSVIQFNTQSYRIVYEGVNYNITDYDDFMEKHQFIKLVGVSY